MLIFRNKKIEFTLYLISLFFIIYLSPFLLRISAFSRHKYWVEAVVYVVLFLLTCVFNRGMLKSQLKRCNSFRTFFLDVFYGIVIFSILFIIAQLLSGFSLMTFKHFSIPSLLSMMALQILIVGVCEEFAFRFCLFDRIEEFVSTDKAIAMCSLIFAGLHLQNGFSMLRFILSFGLSIVFCVLRTEIKASLITLSVAHGLLNVWVLQFVCNG